MNGSQFSGGRNIKIRRLHFYVLHSKCNCIEHFKLHKNWNLAINVNLRLKLNMCKIKVGKNNV